jgi:hypothetical protein
MVQLSFQEELFHLGITCLRFTTVIDGWGSKVWGGRGYLIGDLLYFPHPAFIMSLGLLSHPIPSLGDVYKIRKFYQNWV